VAPLALTLIVAPFEPIAALAHEAVSLVFAVLEWLSRLPGAVWQQHAPVTWTLPFALIGVILMLFPRGFPARRVGIVLLLPLFVVRSPGPAAGELWLTVLDVGQGLAVVARTENHTVLFDTGPDYQGWSDAGRSVVVPYLRGEGVSVIDLLIVSHDDLDHSGGAVSVATELDVRQVLSSVRGTNASMPWHSGGLCRVGQSWRFDKVKFEIIYPDEDRGMDSAASDNDRSCVLRIESVYGVVLLPADIERRSEQHLLDTVGSRLAADVLVAPHHGSKTSSSERFVSAVNAKLVLFPVGYANRYGHPHPAIVARYRDSGAMQMRTDETGAVLVKFGRSGMDVYGWRDSNRRYWNETTK
jgi:competence protein ComEC